MRRGKAGASGRGVTSLPVLTALNETIAACERCPRLRAHCRSVAEAKRAAYRDWTYWGRPVPNLLPGPAPHAGAAEATRLLIVGLAPAAHGANRTGRMFTGDRSGDFLFRGLYEAGLANQPTAQRADDGLELRGVLITATNHCAPPANKPTPVEVEACRPFLDATFDALPNLRAVLTLGGIAHTAALRQYRRRGWLDRPGACRFGHGVVYFADRDEIPTLVGCYHPSQQNTFTGRLTPAMLREVLQLAARHAEL